MELALLVDSFLHQSLTSHFIELKSWWSAEGLFALDYLVC